MSAAMNSFTMSLVGPAISVPVIGAISDMLEPKYGVESLRNALLLIVPAALLLAAVAYLGTASAVRRERLGLSTVKVDFQA